MPSPTPLLSLLLSALLAFPGFPLAAGTSAPVQPVRLYRAKAPAAAAWTLRILPNPDRPNEPGATYIRVLMLRQDRAEVEGLLLTLSARDAKGKSVSRQQATVSMARGQRSHEAFFKVESPDRVPVNVVAALFGDLKPLARCEEVLAFRSKDQ